MSVVSGQWSVVSGQWSVVSGQWSVGVTACGIGPVQGEAVNKLGQAWRVQYG